MKMSEEFPSKYLKAADLKGREVRVIMQNVEREEVGKKKDGTLDVKPALYFKDQDKAVILNKTNAGAISDGYGDDTDDWFDQPLILFSIMTNDPNGKIVPAIRCRVPTAKDNKPAKPARKPDPITSGPQDFPGDRDPDDDIPY